MLKYISGENIEVGDFVTWHGDKAQIELVIAEPVGDSASNWYLTEYGPGVLIREIESHNFGSVYQTEPHEDEDLVFIRRGAGPSR